MSVRSDLRVFESTPLVTLARMPMVGAPVFDEDYDSAYHNLSRSFFSETTDLIGETACDATMFSNHVRMEIL